VYTLMREITLPPELEVGEGYGKVSWDVRAIWENYSGWFHHRSTTELYGFAPDELSADFVDLAGADRVVARAQDHCSAGRPVHAIHLAEAVVRADPGHAGARAVLRSAHEGLLAASTNFWESAWLTEKIGDYS
jgi:alkyl sulfatase BDS1-like metallo-beta-lactamase superfamily hydrolase